MKFYKILFASLCIVAAQELFAQNTCNETVFSSDFTNPAEWTIVGNGALSVSGGQLNFDQVFCPDENRVYQAIGTTLSNQFWKASCDFTMLSPNLSGSGVGGLVLGLSAGTQDWMMSPSGNTFVETDQDGIAVFVTSMVPADDDVNNWFFLIESKKGNVRSYDISLKIQLSPLIQNYYISLSRISTSQVELGVYSDPEMTQHIAGSPIVYSVDPTISNLTTIQHGTNTGGSPSRSLYVSFDNDLICQNNPLIGIEEKQLPEFQTNVIYPNPTTSEIYWNQDLKSNFSENSYCVIYNALGEELIRTKVDFETELNVDGLSNGLYLMKVYDSKQSIFTRFQKMD